MAVVDHVNEVKRQLGHAVIIRPKFMRRVED